MWEMNFKKINNLVTWSSNNSSYIEQNADMLY